MKHLNSFVLVLIIALGLFLNFHKLGDIPNGFYVDEALASVNAKSILVTGRDEFGKFMPLSFRYFVSYSPPLHVYTLVPLIKLFGNSIAVTRSISAISATLMILVVYYFAKYLNIFKHKYTPLIAALLIAISPWNVFFARTGYELYYAFFIFTLGITLTYSARNKYLKYLGLILLSLSAYASFTQRFLLPLALLLLLYLRKIKLRDFTLPILIQTPNMYLMTTASFWTKNSLLTGFNLRDFLALWSTYFSPRSLFFLGDPDPQRSMPELSVFYSWMVVPYIIGLVYLIKSKSRHAKFILFLTLIAPLPASLSSDPFSTQRALQLLFPMILIISYGTEKIISKYSLKIWLPVLVILFAFSMTMLWRSYFILLPNERASAWSYGYKELSEIILNNPNKKFIIDESRSKPHYIELAYFMNLDSTELQTASDPSVREDYYNNITMKTDYKFRNVEIRNINWEEDIQEDLVLVGDDLAISDNQAREHGLVQMFEIKNPLNNVAFKGYVIQRLISQ